MINKPKIGVICPFPFPLNRGSPLRAFKMCESLSNEFEVHVITYHIGEERDYPFKIHRIQNLPFRWKEAGASYKKAICDCFLLVKALNVTKKEKLKLLHGHLHEGAFISTIVSFFLRVPVIYDAHGTLVAEMIETGFLRKDSPVMKFWKYIEMQIQSSTDHVVAQSKMRKKALINDGIDKSKITVITDAAKMSIFSKGNGKKIREKYGWQNEIILYAGSLHKYQGVDILLESFQVVAKKKPNVLLLFFGEQNVEQYKKLANSLKLNNVIFIDNEPYENLPNFLDAADIAVAPRLYGKNVPGKVMDYIASGTPVIGSRTEGIIDVINYGETGILVEPGNKEELTDAILYLLDNPDIRERMGRNAKKLAEEEYDWDKSMDTLKKIYWNFLEGELTINQKKCEASYAT